MSGVWGDLSSSQETALNSFLELVKEDHAKVREKRRQVEGERAANPKWDADLPAWIDRPIIYTPEEEQQMFIHEALRFLRARKFDVTKAVAKYRGYIQFYESKDGYRLLDKVPPKLDLIQLVIPQRFGGEDRDHRPLYIEFTGRVNADAILANFTEDDIVYSHIWGQELLVRRAEYASKKFGKNIETFSTVIDVTGVNLGHRKALKYVQAVAAIDEAYYPERAGRVYVVHTPWVFPVIWNIIKYWLDPVTKAKINVLKGKAADALPKYFDASSLPIAYGGNQPDIVIPNISHILAGIIPGGAQLESEKVEVAAGETHTVDVPGGQRNAA